MAKAVAIHAVVVVALIGMLLFFALIIFWHWLNLQQIEASKAACAVKFSNCCLEWYKKDYQGDPCDWASIPPKGNECDKFNIIEPTSKDQCKL